MEPPSPKVGYAVTGCGCFLALVAVGVALFGAFHVILDPRGAISDDEAMPALLGGGCCAFPSLLIAGLGVFLALRAKKAAAAPAPKKAKKSAAKK